MKQFFIFLLLLPTIVFAQRKSFHLGVSGAANVSFILNQNNFGTLAPFGQQVVRQSELAYLFTGGGTAGVNFGYFFDDKWGLEMHALYLRAGQHYEDDMAGPATIPQGTFGTKGNGRVKVKRSIDFNYIQIPILAKFTYGDELAKFHAALGPSISALVSGKEKVSIAGYDYIDSKNNFTFDEKFRKYDFGIALNLGVDIWFGKNLFLNIGLHSYCSILDINGNKMREVDWYSKNDLTYQKSYNFYTGLNVGIHYVFVKRKLNQF